MKLQSYLKSAPSYLNAKFHVKQNTLSLEPRIPYLCTFRSEFEKAIVKFEIRTFKFVKIQSSMLNKQVCYQNLDIFGLEFEKAIVLFEISTFEFVKMQSFPLKKDN